MYLKTFDPTRYRSLSETYPALFHEDAVIYYYKDEHGNQFRKIVKGKEVQWWIRWPFKKVSLTPKS